MPFPFTDRAAVRRRPTLVASRPAPLGSVVRHSVLAMITSAGHRRWPLDVSVSDLRRAGLPAPSVVRMKLLTLDDRLVERTAGKLTPGDARSVTESLAKALGLSPGD